jgi:hypothetical protein
VKTVRQISKLFAHDIALSNIIRGVKEVREWLPQAPLLICDCIAPLTTPSKSNNRRAEPISGSSSYWPDWAGMTIFSANGSTNARQFEFRAEFYPRERHSLFRRGSFMQVALHQLDLLLLRDNDSLSKTPQNGVATVLGMSISP